MPRVTLRELVTRFGTPDQCLDFIRDQRWPDGIPCKTCDKVTPHHRVKRKKAYACKECRTQTFPLTGTIFEKTRVPLPDWFFVIWQFANTRAGFSAKQVEREIGVSYPTALRICNLIRSQLGERPTLAGVVEADECYIGGRPRYRGQSKRGRGTRKVPVIGAVERGGSVTVKAVDNVRRDTVIPFLTDAVEEGATVYTDELHIYNVLPEHGFDHDRVKHKDKEYVRYTEDGRKVHTNTLEGFWSYPKSAILRIHRGVSRHKLQGYLDEHTFRYNRRHEPEALFSRLLGRLVTPQPSA
ncbi:MAG: IS1595 family transposase [Bacteroidota bacterium]